MGWIKVKKNNNVFTVSTEAYKELFEQQGYEVIEKPITPTQPIIQKGNLIEQPNEVKRDVGVPKGTSNSKN